MGATLGRYQLERELGSGGMATVYRARDRELRREVALKVLFPHLSKRPEVVARFLREARAAAALDHANIVRVYDTGGGAGSADDDDALSDPPYLVMELVEGRSLDGALREHGPFLGEIVAAIGMLLCDALAEAHRAGIVHRDVKPANVMVTRRGRVALTDFGVARLDDDDSAILTRTGMLLGTPAFMSPEQALGDPLDARSDIYSLGATLYQLATGKMPYSGSTQRILTAIIEHKTVPPLQRNPAMGGELAGIIEHMMAAAPADRYQNADEASDALLDVVMAGGIAPGPDAVAEQLARFFAAPADYTEAMVPKLVAISLERARAAAAENALPQAMAFADRALALDDDCDEAVALVERLGTHHERRVRNSLLVAAALVAVIIASATDFTLWPRDSDDAANSDDSSTWVGGGVLIPDASPQPGARGRDDGARSIGDGDQRAALTAPATTATATPDPGAAPPASPGTAAATADTDTERDSRKPRTRATTAGASARPRAQRPAVEPAAEATIDAGAPERAVVAIDAATAVVVAPAPATVTVDIKQWCDLSIDGSDYGRAQRTRAIELPAGRHRFVCSQGPGRSAWRQTVTLRPGERRQLSGSVLAPVSVRVEVSGGDAVRIDGTRHDNGARLQLDPGRYRIAVLSRDQERSYDYVSIPAVASCTVRDRPTLDCYR
ncbi:serine/threonine protein kinase [Haliangium ochraceum DSM 14365]|uniref:non-specific serine/threonine protein kinase n=1 Tax=Haliangium ochraceum (strain DSM 14365 / JCM 11303 / SMP-2) TaxID=502025 RepID=D0LHQ8_HALO1|nr:serine/threonine protein kinase [Haliangium ochraceum DSM 14365]